MNQLINPTVVGNTLAASTAAARSVIADLSEQDLSQLIRFGYIEPMPSGSRPLGSVRVFSVMEKMKENGEYSRRRFLAVPDLLNDLVAYPGEIELPNVERIVSGLKHEAARTGDFVAFFTHFPLPEDVRDYYSFPAFFQSRLPIFRCRTICTGQRQCPCVAQCLSASLAARAVANTDCDADAYIDNIRISGTALQVSRCWLALSDSIAQLNLKFENLTEEPEYDFLGVRCHQLTSHRATERALTKLRARADRIFGRVERSSLRDLLSLLGSLMWISRVAEVKIGRYYACLKNARRKCQAGGELDEPTGVFWASAIPAWKSWCHEALLNVPKSFVRNIAVSTCIFSDASLDGWGAVVIRDNPAGIALHFGPWGVDRDELPHINELEARAFLYAIQNAPDARPHEQLIAFIDNTSVVRCLAECSSANFAMNECVVEARRIIEAKGYTTLATHWVGTLANLADHFTRIQGLRTEISIVSNI